MAPLSTITIDILNRKIDRTAEESDTLEIKIGVILPTSLDILTEGKGRKYGMNLYGGKKL